MQVLPIKRWLSAYDNACCRFLIQDKRYDVKGVWSIIVLIPAFIITCCTRNPQVIVTYTGGIGGTFILFIFPVTLFLYAKNKITEQGTLFNEKNPNASYYQSNGWAVMIYTFSFVTMFCVLWGAAHGHGGE